jgi:hypothetical protein
MTGRVWTKLCARLRVCLDLKRLGRRSITSELKAAIYFCVLDVWCFDSLQQQRLSITVLIHLHCNICRNNIDHPPSRFHHVEQQHKQQLRRQQQQQQRPAEAGRQTVPVAGPRQPPRRPAAAQLKTESSCAYACSSLATASAAASPVQPVQG